MCVYANVRDCLTDIESKNMWSTNEIQPFTLNYLKSWNCVFLCITNLYILSTNIICRVSPNLEVEWFHLLFVPLRLITFQEISRKMLHNPSVPLSFRNGIFLTTVNPVASCYNEGTSRIIYFLYLAIVPFTGCAYAGEFSCSHIKMNGYNHVEPTLSSILRAIYPSNEDWTARFHIIHDIRAIVGSIDSLRGV